MADMYDNMAEQLRVLEDAKIIAALPSMCVDMLMADDKFGSIVYDNALIKGYPYERIDEYYMVARDGSWTEYYSLAEFDIDKPEDTEEYTVEVRTYWRLNTPGKMCMKIWISSMNPIQFIKLECVVSKDNISFSDIL